MYALAGALCLKACNSFWLNNFIPLTLRQRLGPRNEMHLELNFGTESNVADPAKRTIGRVQLACLEYDIDRHY
jgi:hypothetical protein